MNRAFGIMINSWNVQGSSKSKLDVLVPLLSASYANLLVLQEEGVPGTTGFQKGEKVLIGDRPYICVSAEKDCTAKNYRCSTAILAEEILCPHIVGAGEYLPEVQRPMCYVDLASGVRVATIHATANEYEAVSEVKEEISWLDMYAPSNGWILTGDFNSCPGDYPLHIAGNPQIALFANRSQEIPYAANSSGGIYFCNMLFDANPTQGARGVRTKYYDFTFYRSDPGFSVTGIRNRYVCSERINSCMDFMCSVCKNNVYVSDHNLIQTMVYM